MNTLVKMRIKLTMVWIGQSTQTNYVATTDPSQFCIVYSVPNSLI